MQYKSLSILTLAGLALLAQQAAAATEAQQCEAAKLKAAGKYNFCRLKARAKAVKTGDSVDDAKCQEKFLEKFADADLAPSCPTTGDIDAIEIQVTTDADFIGQKLTGVRFTDNGDGTVTDVQTGLVWEMKDDLGGIHDRSDFYSWSSTGAAPDGTAFTSFLATLNNGTSADGNANSGCFAGHCDWRLPTSEELQTILSVPCITFPCIDATFGPTTSGTHWTSTTKAGSPGDAWTVSFSNGSVSAIVKGLGGGGVRAVRGGL